MYAGHRPTQPLGLLTVACSTRKLNIVTWLCCSGNIHVEIQVFWDVTVCRLVNGCRRFEGSHFLHVEC